MFFFLYKVELLLFGWHLSNNTEKKNYHFGCGNTGNPWHLSKVQHRFSKCFPNFVLFTSVIRGYRGQHASFLFAAIIKSKKNSWDWQPKWRFTAANSACTTLMSTLLHSTLSSSQLCLVCSISVSRELQGKSPWRWRWYKYSSTCRLMLRTSGSRSNSCPNLSKCPGWLRCVCSIRARFTRSWVCSTCLRFCTDLMSREQWKNIHWYGFNTNKMMTVKWRGGHN